MLSVNHRLKTILGLIVVGAILLGGVGYITSFKVMDKDFWWHVKAGEIMLENKSLISAEPFSYTIADKPYGALHEWLAQIVMAAVWLKTGVTGIMALRIGLITLAFGFILSIDCKRAWLFAPLALWAAYINRPSLMDRPQLFTFAFCAASLALAVYYLRSPRHRRLLFAAWLAIQLLWVNLHGAAAIISIIIIGALAAEQLVSKKYSELKYLGALLTALIAISFVSPETYTTFTDLITLSSDATIPLVNEWQPRSAAAWTSELGPFFLLAALALITTRRHIIFSGLLLAITTYLSLQAYRHGLIFTLIALGLTIYQLSHNPTLLSAYDWLRKKPLFAVGLVAMGLFLIAIPIRANTLIEFRRANLLGLGTHEPAAGAFNFIQDHEITGPLFNTYNLGGYLLYRGHPDRPVFIDGRNVEYGFELLDKTLRAGLDEAVWRELADKYQFTHALIDYKATPGYDYLPYSKHLNTNSDWSLVYLDDWTALYVKNIPANQKLITTHSYQIITPEHLEFGTALEAGKDNPDRLETELRQLVSRSAGSIKGRLLLGRFYLEKNNLAEAKAIVGAAEQAQPYRPEIYELLGEIAVADQDWVAAGDYFERSVELTGGHGPAVNYEYLAEIFSKAGDGVKAEKYHKKYLRNPPSYAPTPSPGS